MIAGVIGECNGSIIVKDSMKLLHLRPKIAGSMWYTGEPKMFKNSSIKNKKQNETD